LTASQCVYVHKTRFRENHKDTKVINVPLRGHTTFVLLTPAHTTTIIDKITNYWKHIFYIMSYRNNVGLGIKSTAGLRLWKSGMDIMPLRIHSSLMNCFNSHFLRFYNELKFHILSRNEKMLGLSPCIKMDIAPLCCQQLTHLGLRWITSET